MGFEEKMIMNGEPDDEEQEEEEEEEEEDLVDPIDSLREKCVKTEDCIHAQKVLDRCEIRVGSRSVTKEDCTEELLDFVQARDHCVALKMFYSLK